VAENENEWKRVKMSYRVEIYPREEHVPSWFVRMHYCRLISLLVAVRIGCLHRSSLAQSDEYY